MLKKLNHLTQIIFASYNTLERKKGGYYLKRFIIMLSILIILIVLTIVCFLSNKNEEEKEGVTKLKVAEVTHSVFYAPW